MKTRWRGHSKISWAISAFVVAIVILAIIGSNTGTNKKASQTGSTSVGTAKPTIVKNANYIGYLKYGISGSGKDMSSVAGDFTVPSIKSAASIESLSAWVGIGGYGNFKKDLIQIGVVADTGPNLGPTGVFYYPFWECAPQLQHIITSYKARPGDKLAASISKSGTGWLMVMNNLSNGGKFQAKVACSPDRSTAEWILEDVQPVGWKDSTKPAVMPVFTSSRFSNLRVNGREPGLSNMLEAVVANGTHSLYAPSALNTASNSFTVSYKQ